MAWCLALRARSQALVRCSRCNRMAGEKETMSRHPPAAMALVANLIQLHARSIFTCLQHETTIAGLETVKAAVRWVKKTAPSVRNVEPFETAISFHCRGPDPYADESRRART